MWKGYNEWWSYDSSGWISQAFYQILLRIFKHSSQTNIISWCRLLQEFFQSSYRKKLKNSVWSNQTALEFYQNYPRCFQEFRCHLHFSWNSDCRNWWITKKSSLQPLAQFLLFFIFQLFLSEFCLRRQQNFSTSPFRIILTKGTYINDVGRF